MPEPKALVLGGGVAGLTAALELARFGAAVDLVEIAPFAGGHAAGFACKATGSCVRCGACLVEERLEDVLHEPLIRVLTSTRLLGLERKEGVFLAELSSAPRIIDPARCTGCGLCLAACEEAGAVIRGPSPFNNPPYAVDADRCLSLGGGECNACEEACPESAIALDARAEAFSVTADTVILATGFRPFDPGGKPYGYGRFQDVITNLELELTAREQGRVVRPSTGSPPSSIAFIQCVGSRDERLGHLWCSRVCCGSSIRMAGWIRHRSPETELYVFYIDIQNFGRDFEEVVPALGRDMTLIRAIPGEVLQGETGLRVRYFDPSASAPGALDVELVVLSVGITPGPDPGCDPGPLGLERTREGFLAERAVEGPPSSGVFAAGTALGPMGIVDSIRSAQAASWRSLRRMGLL